MPSPSQAGRARLLTEQEAADYLGVPLATLRFWRYRPSLKSPRIPYIHLSDRHIRYPEADLQAYVESRRVVF